MTTNNSRRDDWIAALPFIAILAFGAGLMDTLQLEAGHPVIHTFDIFGLEFFYTYGMVFLIPVFLWIFVDMWRFIRGGTPMEDLGETDG